MLSTKLKEAAGNSADATLYVDDVFSTYLYTGNGSTQTITNGIDLAGKGGLVWGRPRNIATDFSVFDSTRGSNWLLTNGTNAQFTGTGFAMTSTGFSMTSLFSSSMNMSGQPCVSWTFRKAAKFFDVVTYTGTGSARTIAHSLGVAPGMVIVKRTDTTGNWQVYSNGLTSAAYSIQLNLTDAQASAPTVWNSTAPTSSVFSVGTDATVNASGGTYVAYLFAHDTSSTGIIQCGSYTGNGSATGPTVNLGWEPQYVLIKDSTSAFGWTIQDTMRGMSLTDNAYLYANLANAEANAGTKVVEPTATGFTINVGSNLWNASGDTFIYMAIRMPNKPPTTGTQVYLPVAQSSTNVTTNFVVDSVWSANRGGNSYNFALEDRLIGSSSFLVSSSTNSENTGGGANFQSNISVNTFIWGATSNIYYAFKRAPGFFDVVCYTGTGSATTQAHNLGVVPELMIVKARSAATEGEVYVAPLGNDMALNLFYPNNGAAFTTGGIAWNYTTPTSSVFSLGTWNKLNGSGVTFVAYLFATLAGISKVGSYTGNGTGQAIACGFSAGARFVLIKRTDNASGWYTFDSARGLTSGSSPYLLLNSTAAEVTGNNGVYASTGGFTLGATASTTTNINAATYIFLAVA